MSWSRFFLLGLAACLLLVVSESSHGDHHIDFSYLGWNGPEKWGSLSPKYAECAKGKAQSPINIITKEVIENNKLKPLVRHYHSTNATLINNGFNIGVLLYPLSLYIYIYMHLICVVWYPQYK
ncbi:hypothetical protein QQ045_029337 [Rhodiola kirilowii]